MKTEEIVRLLREYAPHADGTPKFYLNPAAGGGGVAASGPAIVMNGGTEFMAAAADRLEAQEQELIDERYRHDRYADFCVAQGDELSRLKAQTRWIPVAERLPEDDEDVLVLVSGDVSMGYFNIFRGYWVDYESDDDNVTHWMPLPEPPKEVE